MSDYFDEVFGKKEDEPVQETPVQTPAEPEMPEVPAEPEAPKLPAEPEAPAPVEPETVPAPAAEPAPEVPEVPAAEPVVPEAPAEAAPAPAEEAQAAPQVPEVPAAPAAPAASKAPEPPVNPNRATYFTPTFTNTPNRAPAPSKPTSVPPVQPPVQYRQPQQFSQPANSYNVNKQEEVKPAVQPAVTPAAPQKKSGRGLLVIMIIAIICAVVAIAGLWISSRNNGSDSGDKDNKNDYSFFDDFTNEDEDEDEDKDDNGNGDAQVDVNSSDEAAKTDENGNLTVAGVVEKVKNSCVGITVYTKQDAYSYFYNYGQGGGDSGDETPSGEGSGVIISEANGKTYIMTCAHVIADGSSFKVTLDNDDEYDATMVGYDSQTDIGVLSIDKTGLSVAEFGDSGDIELGEDCIAIGCPGGLTFKNSVTRGIVSGLDVPVSSSIGYSNECIQVDAAINPGNSGGALFNMQGQVIGINSSKIASTDYEGMGFAVPSNTAVDTANALVKNGYVSGRAKLGIRYTTLENYNSAQSILSALSQKGYENAEGTMVIQEIESESDLNGKVKQYDMIVAVNGDTLTSVDVLTSVLSKSDPGDTVKLTIARINGNKIETFDINCKLIESKN